MAANYESGGTHEAEALMDERVTLSVGGFLLEVAYSHTAGCIETDEEPAGPEVVEVDQALLVDSGPVDLRALYCEFPSEDALLNACEAAVLAYLNPDR